MKSVLSEFDLLEFCRCPLRLAGSPVPKHEYGLRMDAALATLVQQAFNGKTPAKAQIIQALDTVREFNRLDPKRDETEFSRSYQARLAVADTLAAVFRGFSVLLPVSKYRLQLDKLKIEGEYAVLQRRVRGAQPTILQLRADPIKRTGDADNCLPNIISYLRHCHLAHAHGYRDANVLYLHVPSGDYASMSLSLPQSQFFVRSAAAAYAAKGRFPVPGPHCESCLSLGCLDLEIAA